MTEAEARQEILNAILYRKTELECELVTAPDARRATIQADIKACGELYEEFSEHHQKLLEREAKEADRRAELGE